MNLLDENIRHDQGQQLRRWRVPCRFLIEDFAPSGIQDPDIIPLLHRLKHATLFTHDRDFFRQRLAHPAYCLVWLDVFDGAAARYVREFLRHSSFDTAAKRMGVAARVHQGGIDYWRCKRHSLARIEWTV